MSNVVEDRIINLKFNNKDFEKNAAQSMKTIDALEEKLTFKKIAGKGTDAFKGIISAASKIPSALEEIADKGSFGIVSKIKAAFSKNGDMFSPLLEMATGAFRQIGQEAYQLGKNVATSLTTQQVSAGWDKYADKTRSVQTIMNATGKSIEEVTEALSKLNWYSDETSYSYTDMTSNIAKFTSSGVDLNTAVTAMIGIGNAAGLAGASVENASHAMAGFAKAIGQGYMDRQKWSWIETAQMDTQQFKKSLIEAAVALGELHSNGDGTYYSNNGKELTSLTNFENDMASGKWMTAEVILRALKDYGALTNKVYDVYQSYNGEKTTSEILDEMGVSAENLGLKAFKASQEAKTFADAIESVKDAVSTGWMTTFDTIFGNYMEAKKLWTDFANWLYDMFAESGNYRNSMLEIFMGRQAINEDAVRAGEETEREYYKIGEQLISGRDYFLQAIYKFMDVISAYAEAIKMAWDRTFGTWDYETIGKIAKQIHRVAEILGATLQKDLAMDPRKVSEWEWLDNQNRNSFIVYFRLSMESFFNIIKESAKTLKTMGKIFYESLYDAFGDKNDRTHGFYFSGFYKWFRDFTARVAKFIKTFRDVLTESDRFKRILNGNFAILKIFFNIIRDTVDFIIHNGGGVIAIIAEFMAGLGDLAVSMNNSKLYDFIRSLLPVINNLVEKVLSGILKIVTTINKVKDFLIDFFTSFGQKTDATGSIEKLTTGVKNLAGAIADLLGFTELKDFIGGLNEEQNEKTFLDSVVDTADKAVAALGGFFDLVAAGIEKVKEFGTALAGVAGSVANSVSDIVASIFGSNESGVNGAIPGTEQKVSIFEALRQQASSMLTNMFSDVDEDEVSAGATSYTGSVIGGVIEGVRNAIAKLEEQGVDWSKIKALGYFAGFIITLININKDLRAADDLIGNITDIPESIAKAIANFGGVFNAVKEFLVEAKEALEDYVAIEKIEVIAKVISTMAMIVMLLGEIPEENLAKGVTYLGIIAAIFAAFNKALTAAGAIANINYMKDSVQISKSFMSGNTIRLNNGLLGVAALVVAMASFISSFVTMISTINGIEDTSKVNMAVGIVLVTMTVMTALIGIIGKVGKDFQTTINQYSYSDSLLANGTKKNAESRNTLTGFTGKFFYGIAAALLALSVGVRLIAGAITALADAYETHSPESMLSAVLVVFGTFSLVIISVFGLLYTMERWTKNAALDKTKMSAIGKTMLLVGSAISIIVGSVMLLLPSIALLAAVFALIKDPTSVGLAVGVTAGIMVIMMAFIVILMNTMKQLQPAQINRIGRAMLLISTSIIIIAAAVAIVTMSIVGLIAALIVEGKIAELLKQDKAIMAAIIVVGAISVAMMVFISVLMDRFKYLTSDRIEKIGPTMIKIAEAMVIVATSVFIIGAALALVTKVGATIQQGASLAIVIVAAFGSLLAISAIMKKMDVDAKEVKTIAESMIYVSAAVLILAGSVAVIANLDVEAAKKNAGLLVGVFLGLLGVVAIAAVISHLLSPIGATAVGSILNGLGFVMISFAAILLSFSVAIVVFTKCIEPLTQKLPAFGTALTTFLTEVGGTIWNLVPIVMAFSIIGVILAMAIAGIITLIVVFRNQIGSALQGVFDGIKNLFKAFGDWFKDLPKKTQTMITAFVIAISSGLVAATPRMYEDIQKGFLLLMERLGDSVGWITKGLLALVINVIDSLADAINDNADVLAYTLYKAFAAIGNVLVDLLFPLIATILSPLMTVIMYAGHIIDAAGQYMTGQYGKAADSIASMMNMDFTSVMEDWAESFKETFDEQKLGREIGMDMLAELYGVDPKKTAKQLTQEAKEAATKEIENGKKDMTDKIKDTVTGYGDAAIEAGEESKNKLVDKVSGWKNELGLDFNKIKNEFTNGSSLSDIIQKYFIGEGNLINTDALGDFTSFLKMDGYDTSQLESITSNITAAGGSVDGLTTDIAGCNLALDDNAEVIKDNRTEVGNYTQSLATAEDAERAFANESDSFLESITSRETSFFEAGAQLVDAVERGFNSKWDVISSNIYDKFRQLSSDIRSMLEMGDLNVTVSSVTPVFNGDVSNASSSSVPVVNETKPYNYLWDRDAGKNAMSGEGIYSADKSKSYFVGSRPSGSYYEAMESYGQYLANNISFAKQRDAAQEDFSKMREDMKELKNAFTTFTGKAETFYNKDTNIYLDGDKLVGGTADKIWDVVSIKANQEMRSGG